MIILNPIPIWDVIDQNPTLSFITFIKFFGYGLFVAFGLLHSFSILEEAE